MTVYTSATLEPFLEQVRASNLTASAKTAARQLAADAVALSAKVQALEAELAKLRQQRVNETVNQPSSKKPEWDKGNGADPDKPPRKRKLGGRRPGSGNRPKPNPEPDRSIHNPLERCPDCQTDLTEVPPAGDVNERIIEDMEPHPPKGRSSRRKPPNGSGVPVVSRSSPLNRNWRCQDPTLGFTPPSASSTYGW